MNNFISLLSVSGHEAGNTVMLGGLYYLLLNTRVFETTWTYRVHVPKEKRNVPGPHKLNIVSASYRELFRATNGKKVSLSLCKKTGITVNGPLTIDSLEEVFNTPTSAVYNTVATSLGGLKGGIIFGMSEHPWWFRLGVPLAINTAQHAFKLPITSAMQHKVRIEFLDQEIPTAWPDECHNVVLDEVSNDDIINKIAQ